MLIIPPYHKLKKTGQFILSKKGFTLVELLMVIAIIGVLAGLTIPIYQNFVGKAKVTVAQSTLIDVRSTLVTHNTENGGTYPATIDFTTGLDDKGITVFQPPLLSQINKDLFPPSITYVSTSNEFTLTAQANDDKHTVLILTENSLKTQGH